MGTSGKVDNVKKEEAAGQGQGHGLSCPGKPPLHHGCPPSPYPRRQSQPVPGRHVHKREPERGTAKCLEARCAHSTVTGNRTGPGGPPAHIPPPHQPPPSSCPAPTPASPQLTSRPHTSLPSAHALHQHQPPPSSCPGPTPAALTLVPFVPGSPGSPVSP